MSWLRRFWRYLWRDPSILPPPDRSVKRPAQIAAEAAVLRAKRKREG